ncbi:hypothetical protein [Azospirillum griseum]|uniref:Uncharacterized protein n=1 Tax=Azospirillum griseum TaxID=2496639 RepID=A0A3S0KU31_9PROT|nr:hypothetical protein [Azospirillum griseum]RTR11065.1 hypothetical protein EJ903_26205 [Azospirillum griseum]
MRSLDALVSITTATLIFSTATAEAGTSFTLTIQNNTTTNMVVGDIVTENDWYSDGLAGTSIPSGKTTVITTSMCSSIGCPGKSYIQFPLLGTGPFNGVSTNIYLKGVQGDFPEWAFNTSYYFDYNGGIMTANPFDPKSTVLESSITCSGASGNNIPCTLVLNPATFTTTNPKYGSTNPYTNARNYYDENNNLQTNGVVFNGFAMNSAAVKSGPSGTIVYQASPSTILNNPTCASGSASSYLYVVTMSWNLYMAPVCDERYLSYVPLTYSGTAFPPSGTINPIDYSLPFSQTVQSGYIAITHGGLANAQPVRAAGEMSVINGVVKSINNDSGHYSPSIPALNAFVEYFQSMGYGGAFTAQQCTGSPVCTYTIP